MPDVKTRRARPSEAEFLSALAMRSKGIWKYPAAYLEACRPELTLTPAYIERWPVWVAENSDGRVIGFMGICEAGGKRILDHLWVEPDIVRGGVGRLLFGVARREAVALGWSSFEIPADPMAEAFYVRMGARRIALVESKYQKGLMIPQLEISTKDAT